MTRTMNKQQEIPNDELTQRIAKRLGERQQKLQCMQEWERPARRLFLPRTMAVLSAAACVAIILMVAPWKGYSPLDELDIRPDLTEFRSGYPQMAEMQRLLENMEYEEALVLAEQMLQQSDEEIEEVKVDTNLQYEMAEYECHMMRTMNSELRWTYIYLLVKAKQNEEALQQLERYISDVAYAHHRDEAIALQEKMLKK